MRSFISIENTQKVEKIFKFLVYIIPQIDDNATSQCITNIPVKNGHRLCCWLILLSELAFIRADMKQGLFSSMDY